MNVYSEAHNLAKSIRESEEFKQYDAVKKMVSGNPAISEMLNDYQTKQQELQMKLMTGEASPEHSNAHLQELYGIMMKDPLSAQYLQCEMRFTMMMSDVYKILWDVVGAKLPGQA